VPADYDGDGKADLSVKGSTDGIWYIDYARNGFGAWDASYPGYGPTSIPVPADYDGDGRADLSVKGAGDGIWYIDYASDGFGAWDASYLGYGPTSRPVPADYDGDGAADLSVQSDADGRWYIDYAADGFGAWDEVYVVSTCGLCDRVPADYDGDGRADISVKRDDEFWYVDFAANGFGAWDLVDPLGRPARPLITLDAHTSRSLTVSIDGRFGDWFGNAAATQLSTNLKNVTGTGEVAHSSFTRRFFTNLQADTTYCVEAIARNSEGAVFNTSACFKTDNAPPPPPPTSGTTGVGLQRQQITQGPVPYAATWGPIAGARPVRLWTAQLGLPTFIHFLRVGHSTQECFGPDHADVTVTLRTDGDSLDPAEIALIFGGTPPAGQQIGFAACITTSGSALPDLVFFNLDWGP
jgi:hypothetical protein